MRRMTIFRSELTGAALLAALTTIAGAQQPPAAGALPAQAQPQAAPTQRVTISSESDATQVQAQAPASHTVREGDTLWALAQQYLGDPMLWPEIYRLNTTVVEDPHWIYPGEELRITPEAGGAVTPSADTAVVAQDMTVTPTTTDTQPAQQEPAQMAAAPTTGPTIFSTMGPTRAAPTLQAAGARAYRAVREGEYYSAGFLTENQPLPSGRIIANAVTSNRGTIRTRTSAQMHEDLIVSAPEGQSFNTGDLLLTFSRGAEFAPYGEVITPSGLLRVESAAGPYWVANVFRMFGPVNDGQEVIRITPFVNSTSSRAVPVTNGIQGSVIMARDQNEVSQIQDVLFIDKGANNGLKLGDIVQLVMVRGDTASGQTVEQDQGRAIVVNTRANTATVIIVELYRSDVGPQSKFRQVRRMPS